MSDSKLFKNTGLFLHGQRNIFVVLTKGWSHDRGVSM